MDPENPKSVLLLEDDESQAKTIAAFLRRNGYEVTVALKGIEAVELASSIKPDIMVADLAMEGVNGSEAVSRIAAKPDCKGIKIVFLTALVPATDDAAIGAIKIQDMVYASVSKANFASRLIPVIESLG